MKENASLVSILKDYNIELEDAMMQKFIFDNYTFAKERIVIDRADEFIDVLKKELGEDQEEFLVSYTVESNSLNKREILRMSTDRSGKYESFMLDVQYLIGNRAAVNVYTGTLKELDQMMSFMKEFTAGTNTVKLLIHDLYMTQSGTIASEEALIQADSLGDFMAEFYPDIVDLDAFFKRYTVSDENILILIGESGLGKTKFATMFLKYLQSNYKLLKDNKAIIEKYDEFEDEYEEEDDGFVRIAYVKNEDLLSNDAFWNKIKVGNYDAVILDDLDYFLSSRQQSVGNQIEVKKDAFISNLLSFSDGIFPKYTKFIITTNREVDDVDKALKRDGRLFGIFEFSKLSYEEAENIWDSTGLKKDIFEKEFKGSNEILQSKLGGFIKRVKSCDGEEPEPLLRDGSKADVSGKYTSAKSIGLI